ncbi:MAG: hypothetical protein AB7Q37_07925 [Pyrinomonadaceae bacterium]
MDDNLRSAAARLDRELIARHRFDTELFDELNEFQLSKGLTHGERAISPFLRPYFLGASRYEAIRRAAWELSGAFESLTEAALEYPEIMSLLGMTEAEERFARYEPGYRTISVTSRLDTFLSDSGFKFLEYNAETPAGVGDQSLFAEIYDRVPLVRQFLRDYSHHVPRPHAKLLEAMLAAYREFGGRSRQPNIAIVDWAGVDTAGEFEILARFFESKGYRTIICDPKELEYNGEKLHAGPFEIDIFYKRLIIHEFLERFDEKHPIGKAIADGNVCMINSFRSKIPHKKAGFALLSDDKFHRLFTPQQIESIRAHIPWTRIVTDSQTDHQGQAVDLLKFIRSERFRFILKPNDDYGGKGIVFGWESSESEWDDAIETALDADFVVQERASVQKTDIPVFGDGEASIQSLTVDFDPYLFSGETEGGMVRLAPGSLVNVTQGGGETGLVILEEH